MEDECVVSMILMQDTVVYIPSQIYSQHFLYKVAIIFS